MGNKKDWIGNQQSLFSVLGARNYAQEERETDDYYATPPKALELLLQLETFSPDIWECACGEGHLSETLKQYKYSVRSTDLIDRGYGQGGIDFLKANEKFDGDIITNPPYKYALEFVKKALDVVEDGHKVAMFLKIQFLEGKARRKLFDNSPPRTIYVATSRLVCAKNGNFSAYATSAVCYAWFIWEKGFQGETIVK